MARLAPLPMQNRQKFFDINQVLFTAQSTSGWSLYEVLHACCISIMRALRRVFSQPGQMARSPWAQGGAHPTSPSALAPAAPSHYTASSPRAPETPNSSRLAGQLQRYRTASGCYHGMSVSAGTVPPNGPGTAKP